MQEIYCRDRQVYFGPNSPRNIMEPIEGNRERADLVAVIRALQRIGIFEDAVIYTDSATIVNGIPHMYKWEREGWKDIANAELWELVAVYYKKSIEVKLIL